MLPHRSGLLNDVAYHRENDSVQRRTVREDVDDVFSGVEPVAVMERGRRTSPCSNARYHRALNFPWNVDELDWP